MADFNRRRGPGKSRDFGGGRDFKRRDSGGFGGGDRQMHPAICSNCGKECQVPFRPNGSKPIYCSDCFEKNSDSAGPRRFDDRPSRPPRFEGGEDHGQTKKQLEALNAKVDKILELLTQEV